MLTKFEAHNLLLVDVCMRRVVPLLRMSDRSKEATIGSRLQPNAVARASAQKKRSDAKKGALGPEM